MNAFFTLYTNSTNSFHTIHYIHFIYISHCVLFLIQSLKVAYAAYDTPWYEGNSELRKCVQVMIARSHRPLEVPFLNSTIIFKYFANFKSYENFFTFFQIKSGGLYPMTLENFQAILRISYSYFSMLQGFNQQ